MANIYLDYVNMVDSMAAPGLPETKIVIFKPNYGMFTNGGRHITDKKELEEFVNHELLPYAFLNAVNCNGMNHGSFVSKRSYVEAKEIAYFGEEDYDFDYDVLNYVNAVISSIDAYQNNKDTITLVAYSPDSGCCTVVEYKDDEDFLAQTKDEREWWEEQK